MAAAKTARELSIIDLAGDTLLRMFTRFVNVVHEKEREQFFDPRNRSNWMLEFSIWLKDENRKRGPSND